MQILDNARTFTMVGTRQVFLLAALPQVVRGLRSPDSDWELDDPVAMEEIVRLFPGQQVQYEGRTYTVCFHPDDPRDYPVEFEEVTSA